MFDKAQVIGKWRSILVGLGVDEKFLVNRHGPCPSCHGVDRWRFDDKDGTGSFYCSHCGAGDGFSLVMRLHNCDFKEAVKMVAKELPNAVVIQPNKKPDQRPRIRSIWQRSKEIEAGDEVYRYLYDRGVLPKIIPEDLRIVTDDYFEDGKNCGTFTAMAAKIRGPSGKCRSLHITYLRDGKKALVKSPKKVLAETGQGSSIRLFEPAHELCLAEGIETALAVNRISGKPVWSLISAGNFKHFVCPDGVTRIEIWADHDSNCTGQAAAYSLANRLSTSGIDVDVFIPAKKNSDWADEL